MSVFVIWYSLYYIPVGQVSGRSKLLPELMQDMYFSYFGNEKASYQGKKFLACSLKILRVESDSILRSNNNLRGTHYHKNLTNLAKLISF